MTPTTARAIQDSVITYYQNDLTIPPFIHKISGFLVDSQIFLFFQTYRITTYANPRHAVVTGGTLYYVANFTQTDNYLRTALYLQCALKLYEEYRNVSINYCQLMDALLAKYPRLHVRRRNLGDETASPTFKIIFLTNCKRLIETTKRVIAAACALFISIIHLSLFLRDLTLITMGDKNVEFYACTRLANDLSLYFEKELKTLTHLLEELQSNESLINELLSKLGLSYNFASIIDEFKNRHPQLIKAFKEQFDGAKEDIRVLHEQGIINLSQVRSRPPAISETEEIPWTGQTSD